MAEGSIFSEVIGLTIGALFPIMNPFSTAGSKEMPGRTNAVFGAASGY